MTAGIRRRLEEREIAALAPRRPGLGRASARSSSPARLGTTQSAVSRWERGHDTPRGRHARRAPARLRLRNRRGVAQPRQRRRPRPDCAAISPMDARTAIAVERQRLADARGRAPCLNRSTPKPCSKRSTVTTSSTCSSAGSPRTSTARRSSRTTPTSRPRRTHENLERLAAALRDLDARIRTTAEPEGLKFACDAEFFEDLEDGEPPDARRPVRRRVRARGISGLRGSRTHTQSTSTSSACGCGSPRSATSSRARKPRTG